MTGVYDDDIFGPGNIVTSISYTEGEITHEKLEMGADEEATVFQI